MKKHFKLTLILCLLSFTFFTENLQAKVKIYKADVIIYGGTSSAIIAAVQVARMGKSVLVVSPDVHLGGLSSSGLGFTDTGNKSVIGGLSREFYHRVFLHYQTDGAWKWQKKEEYGNKGQGVPAIDGNRHTMWIFEPHVAEEIFESLIRENSIRVFRNEWLDRDKGVVKEAGKIQSISTLSGKRFEGKMFIDATYEGDLMAAAGVGFSIGREASSVYGETWNGSQVGVFQHAHYFKNHISPFRIPGDSTSGLLPGISKDKPGKRGEGDKKIQAYCFRMCLTNLPENRIAFTRPSDYDSTQYELLLRLFASGWRETFQKFDPIPNRKTDTNNHGPFSTDYIGMNYQYPEASYETRKKIIREHESYQKGLMYFIANDPRVPKMVQAEMKKWGLAGDEFRDNGNWPYMLYIREARRMLGEEIMTENEILGKRAIARSVGMGSYSLDSHNVQRYVTEEGFVQNEGDIGVAPKKPYQISYGAIIPKKSECGNLLVPVCLSSSHIAYGSIRMEPVFMILGQSAATAAVLSIEKKVEVQDLDYNILEKRLLQDAQILKTDK